ncbi:MAG TPA: hypothetical protein VFG04_28650 [Planctomycetaceae bacterium]|jgi:hypothetical protein|nr:hypothetical protein [Planctomycetaceae bacterium]
MSRFVLLVLGGLLLASAAPAFAQSHYPQHQKFDELGHPVGLITDHDPSEKRETPWYALLFFGALTAFVGYEYYRQETVGYYVDEGSQRVLLQWIERSEHPLFFWFYLSVHAVLAAYSWWRCFSG